MKDLSHFELVKLADIARETHTDCESLERLLSDYLMSWAECHAARPGASRSDMKTCQRQREKLLAFLSPG